MTKKATQLYDFNLAAGASFDLPVDANFYKVLTSTGDLAITRNGGSTVRPMRAGRGERNVDFQKLTLRDISGAPNSGTILVGDSDFIDDTIVIASYLNVRPEAATASYGSLTSLGALGTDVVFAPGANTGGAILFNARFYSTNAGNANIGFLAKNAPPTTAIDGDLHVGTDTMGTTTTFMGKLANPVLIPAGKGLYFFSTVAETSAFRNATYKLL